MSLKELDEISLKQMGFIPHRDGESFIARIPIVNGNISSEQLKRIGEIAEKYGKGRLHLTARQSLQIPGVPPEHLDAVASELEANGTPVGSSGPRTRNVTACPGRAECKWGIIETTELAHKMKELFWEEELPVKFKFTVSGCPNACSKPLENDFGVTGLMTPVFNVETCDGCRMCVFTCREGAISLDDNMKAVVDWDKCIECRMCIDSCPQDLISEGEVGYRIFIGGKMGRHPKLGYELTQVHREEEVIELAEKTIRWVLENVEPGERFGAALERLGFEAYRNYVMKEKK
jgi:dissimilatory sulfite reductase (desulfoviridin) alpha/beta subunit